MCITTEYDLTKSCGEYWDTFKNRPPCGRATIWDNKPMKTKFQPNSITVDQLQGILPTEGNAKSASMRFSFWYFEKFKDHNNKKDDEEYIMSKPSFDEAMKSKNSPSLWIGTAKQVHESFHTFGDDLKTLWERFEQLNDYERAIIDDLRDNGASIGDLVDYIRAEEGFNDQDKPVRGDVASHIRRKEFLEKSKRIESGGRSAAILAGSLGLIGLGAVAVTVGAGLVPGFVVASWVPEAISMTWGVVKGAAGGGALLLAWKGWQHLHSIKHGTPKLDIGKNNDFSDLKHSLGHINFKAFNHQVQAIPTADQHLLKHLSPTELRMFFTGSDAARLHLLRANPPSAWAQVQSKLEVVLRPKDSRFKSLMELCKTMLQAPWKREKNDARIPSLRQKLANYREFAEMNAKHEMDDYSLESFMEGEDPPSLSAKTLQLVKLTDITSLNNTSPSNTPKHGQS
mgnify:CR=1 FL=1